MYWFREKGFRSRSRPFFLCIFVFQFGIVYLLLKALLQECFFYGQKKIIKKYFKKCLQV